MVSCPTARVARDFTTTASNLSPSLIGKKDSQNNHGCLLNFLLFGLCHLNLLLVVYLGLSNHALCSCKNNFNFNIMEICKVLFILVQCKATVLLLYRPL